MTKIYKTNLGKPIDLDALYRENENKVAAGNMSVNAKGDELGPGGQVVRNLADRVRAVKTPAPVRKASIKPKVSASANIESLDEKTQAVQPELKEEKTLTKKNDYTETIDEDGNITVEKKTSKKKKD